MLAFYKTVQICFKAFFTTEALCLLEVVHFPFGFGVHFERNRTPTFIDTTPLGTKLLRLELVNHKLSYGEGASMCDDPLSNC